MKTDIVLQRLDHEVAKSKDTVLLKREDAKMILNRIQHLETMAAELLRSVMESNQPCNLLIPICPEKP